jgi:hypothetical protein
MRPGRADWPVTATAEPLEVALDDGTPLLQAGRSEADGEPAVEPPGPPLGAGELRDHGPPGHFEAVAHAGQQPVELVVTQVDRAALLEMLRYARCLPAMGVKAYKESAYLLRSPENARRLLASIDRLEHGGGTGRDLLE